MYDEIPDLRRRRALWNTGNCTGSCWTQIASKKSKTKSDCQHASRGRRTTITVRGSSIWVCCGLEESYGWRIPVPNKQIDDADTARMSGGSSRELIVNNQTEQSNRPVRVKRHPVWMKHIVLLSLLCVSLVKATSKPDFELERQWSYLKAQFF